VNLSYFSTFKAGNRRGAVERKMRCAICGISHETNTFSNLRTNLDDFHIRRGEEIKLGEFFGSFENIEWVPLLLAGASPHGLVSKNAYISMRDEIIKRLRDILPIDGIYMRLHGAMEVEGIGDGESDLVNSIRDVVGLDIPITASLDLHGNIAPKFAELTNALTALRTAPHVDGSQTEQRAVNHLVRCLNDGIRPINILVKIPLLLPGEFAVTNMEPASSLYARLNDIESQDGILDASILIGCAWTDSPYTTVSAIVVAEGDDQREKAFEQAGSLARDIWMRRAEFGPDAEMSSVDDAVWKAVESKEHPFFVSDSGDNVTAGGAGDIPIILEKLLSLNAKDAVIAGLSDSEGVKSCIQAGVGSKITLNVGGKLDKINGYPFEVTGVVEYIESPSLAVLKVDGVKIILTSDRRAFTNPQSFKHANIDPLEQKIIVVKLGYLFAELRPIAKKSVMALSPGFTNLMMDQLPFKNVIRPIYPLDRDFEWNYTPQTPLKRGVRH
jgi:microcystin degradation protein MlrC